MSTEGKQSVVSTNETNVETDCVQEQCVNIEDDKQCDICGSEIHLHDECPYSVDDEGQLSGCLI